MRNSPSLTTKLLAMGAGFLLVALSSIGLTLWVTWKLEGGAAAVNEAGRLRMNMLRMVMVLQTEPVQAVQQQFPPGTRQVCRVNPADPADSVLLPGTRAALYSIWFPLLFVAGGVGMLVGIARRRNPSLTS
jgi:two-component system nitrate/nitrite sensor histidine kinase NarX